MLHTHTLIIIDDMEIVNRKLTAKLDESREDATKTVTELHKRLHETVSVGRIREMQTLLRNSSSLILFVLLLVVLHTMDSVLLGS